jgi:hypothetical protein
MPSRPKAALFDARGKIELRPDGWQRFEAAIDEAVRAGPLHNPKVKSGPVPRRLLGRRFVERKAELRVRLARLAAIRLVPSLA